MNSFEIIILIIYWLISIGDAFSFNLKKKRSLVTWVFNIIFSPMCTALNIGSIIHKYLNKQNNDR